jgi:hypothetical protein
MRTIFQNQIVYTIYNGQQIKTKINLNPFGLIEVEFCVPFTGISEIENQVQMELSSAFENQFPEINKSIDQFNEIVFTSIMLNKRIEKLCKKNQNENQ